MFRSKRRETGNNLHFHLSPESSLVVEIRQCAQQPPLMTSLSRVLTCVISWLSLLLSEPTKCLTTIGHIQKTLKTAHI